MRNLMKACIFIRVSEFVDVWVKERERERNDKNSMWRFFFFCSEIEQALELCSADEANLLFEPHRTLFYISLLLPLVYKECHIALARAEFCKKLKVLFFLVNLNFFLLSACVSDLKHSR